MVSAVIKMTTDIFDGLFCVSVLGTLNVLIFTATLKVGIILNLLYGWKNWRPEGLNNFAMLNRKEV